MQNKILKPSPVKYHPTLTMRALEYSSKEHLQLKEVPMAIITDPTDVIVKVTASTICGSDLRVYHGMIPGMKGSITGHESIGIVDDIGPQVKKFKLGDRVVISSVIACGLCNTCKRGALASCETTHTSSGGEGIDGHSTEALLGSSRTFGGYDGCHAEYVRVPFAETNLFPIPDYITDNEAILVADVACAGFCANVLADVKPGDRVVVFGCGPVGLLTQMWANYRGASMIVAIDVDEQRLDFAKEKLGSITFNSKEEDTMVAVETLIPGGPEKIIDCVGFRPPQGFFHKVQMKLKMESDAPNIVNLAIKMVKKEGRITIIGDYVGYCNSFNIGGLVEKQITLNGGHLMPHRYYKEIFEAIASKKINPTIVLTHWFPMSKFDEAYRIFDKHEDGILKPLIIPDEIYYKGGIDIKHK